MGFIWEPHFLHVETALEMVHEFEVNFAGSGSIEDLKGGEIRPSIIAVFMV